MHSRSRSSRATRGRSLVEIIAGIALAAIMMAMAVPNFTGLRGPFLVRQGAQQVAAEFQRARMQAIARNATYQLVYSSTNQPYQLQRQNGGSWVTEYTNQLPSGVTITGISSSSPNFNSRGMLDQAYTITVTAAGYATTRTVSVNVLGQISIT